VNKGIWSTLERTEQIMLTMCLQNLIHSRISTAVAYTPVLVTMFSLFMKSSVTKQYKLRTSFFFFKFLSAVDVFQAGSRPLCVTASQPADGGRTYIICQCRIL
jgi:hypothetical protein